MAGKRSSAWDHVVWVYLPLHARARLVERATGLRAPSGLSGLLHAMSRKRWRRLTVCRRIVVVLSGIGVPLLLLMLYGRPLLVAAGMPLYDSPVQRAAVVAMVCVGASIIAMTVADSSWRARERRAIRLRRERVRPLEQPAPVDQLARELLERSSYWRERLGRRPTRAERDLYFQLDRVAWAFGLAPWLILLPPLLTRALGGSGLRAWAIPLLFPLALLCSILGSTVLLRIRFGWARRRLLAALDARACPDCDYDLRTVRPDAHMEAMGLSVTGPARCVECGAPWPLVPAAIPVESPEADEAAKPPWQKDLLRGWKRRRRDRRARRAAALARAESQPVSWPP